MKELSHETILWKAALKTMVLSKIVIRRQHSTRLGR